jgi:hypothetical protein
MPNQKLYQEISLAITFIKVRENCINLAYTSDSFMQPTAAALRQCVA